MPHPTQRHTKSRKRIRRAAIKQKSVDLSVCPQCQRPVKSHHACAFCGTYKGKAVLKLKLKKSVRKKRKEIEKERDKKQDTISK